MLTWKGSQPRPSTAIAPSAPNAIAGSLFPVEFEIGDVVTPAGGDHVAIRGVFENAVVAPAPVANVVVASVVRAASAIHRFLGVCMSIPRARDEDDTQAGPGSILNRPK